MTELKEMTLRGDQPIKAAIRMLKTYEDDDISGIIIQFEPNQHLQAQYDEFSYDSESKHETTDPSTANSGLVDNSQEDGVKREEGTIKPQTTHHWVLYLLNQLGAQEEYVPGARVKDESVKTPASDSSIYPALTNLYERMITKRTQQGGSYAYKLTNHGQTVLNELGEPENENKVE